MSHTLAASRLGRWGTALALATAGALAFSASASATIYRPTNSTQFRQAVLDANANPGYDKIVIGTLAVSPTTNLVISDDLYITGDHALEAPGEGPTIDGSSVDIRAAHFITVNAGVRLHLAGLNVTAAASFGFSTIENLGHFRLDNGSIVGNDGRPLNMPNTVNSSAVITNSLISDNFPLGPAIFAFSPVTINNTTMTDNGQGGIEARAAFEMHNTIMTGNNTDCFNNPSPQSGNLDSDGTCGTAATGNPQLDFINFYGGPTASRQPFPGSPVINAGDNAFCNATDQRFFVRPVGTCDIGSYEVDAVRDTIPPSCAVSAVRRGPDQQDVTVSDSEGGLGYDGVFSEEITITNGTVASAFGLPATGVFPTPTRPGTSVLTASKADQLQRTRWSFTLRDWAGNVRTCS